LPFLISFIANIARKRPELKLDKTTEHWTHIRTTNPIESIFATVRNRTRKTRGCLNRTTALAMVYKFMILFGTLLRNTLSGIGQPKKMAQTRRQKPPARDHSWV